jgi:isoleucyl-tRNA synthetase
MRLRPSGIDWLQKRACREKAMETIDESIELHRPYVDEVHINVKNAAGP